jgi:integrase
LRICLSEQLTEATTATLDKQTNVALAALLAGITSGEDIITASARGARAHGKSAKFEAAFAAALKLSVADQTKALATISLVEVKLKGLKIASARGKWYVYDRATGTALIKGFDGDREALERKMAAPEFIGAWNAGRKPAPASYAMNTLGWLVHWFKNEYVGFKILAQTTQDEYSDSLDALEADFDTLLSTITTPLIYEVRDKIALSRTPHFADRVTKALSTMFTQAVRRDKGMTYNPALGIEKIHKPNKNANREWRPPEWVTVMERAPPKFKTLFMLARHIGYRGQSISRVQWSNYQPDPTYGKCFRATHNKNDEHSWLPASQDLQDYLDALDKTSTFIATRPDGTPWETEKQMQTAVSNWLKALEREGVVGHGLTLHGLRVSFAAGIRRSTGASPSDIAAALGDRDERMGEHYTRHVEQEARVIRAFPKPKKRAKSAKSKGR